MNSTSSDDLNARVYCLPASPCGCFQSVGSLVGKLMNFALRGFALPRLAALALQSSHFHFTKTLPIGSGIAAPVTQFANPDTALRIASMLR